MAQKESVNPDEMKRLTLLNHSLYRRTIDFGGENGMRTTLIVPSGRAAKLQGRMEPGRIDITKEQWDAIKKHPTASKMVKNGTLSVVEG
jgi:hypothetical protein